MNDTSIRIFEEAAIRGAVGLNAASLAAIEGAFTALASGRVIMPPPLGMHIEPVRGEVHVKTAYVLGAKGFAVKLATGFYGNARLGLANSSGLVLYLDAQTGFVRAVFVDDGYLTDLRTALAGAVAAKHLAPKEVHTVGIVGCGIQARWQLRALALVREFSRVLVFGRNAAARDACIAEMQSMVKAKVTAAQSVGELVAASDLVVTATPAREALAAAEHLHPGLHITAMGSDGPGKQELHPEILRKADMVVCDSYEQCRRLGELQSASLDRDSVIELGELTSGAQRGRSNEQQITVCDLTGTGVQDSAIAEFAYGILTK
jgi:ornithine cyclodeaminase/alanine dehydrogenase-like protein (mu-crystallin family)